MRWLWVLGMLRLLIIIAVTAALSLGGGFGIGKLTSASCTLPTKGETEVMEAMIPQYQAGTGATDVAVQPLCAIERGNDKIDLFSVSGKTKEGVPFTLAAYIEKYKNYPDSTGNAFMSDGEPIGVVNDKYESR